MANSSKRLGNILSHLSPPLRELELGHLSYECEGPKTDREAKLLENLMLSRLGRFETCSAEELQFVPCSSVQGESKPGETGEGDWDDSLEAVPVLVEEEDEEGVAVFDGETVVRSGITSASALSTSSAGGGGHVQRKDFKSHVRVAACEFCDIIHGTAPCFKLYEDELCLCILDINPLSVGHSLVLPKSHFSCLEATPPQVAAAMCAMVPRISRALLAATRCDSFNMLVNSGVAAGQVIMHTHFHIIPRCKDDGLWKSESASRRPLRKVQEAKLLAQAVRTKLSFTI